jgi:hypothetical protein
MRLIAGLAGFLFALSSCATLSEPELIQTEASILSAERLGAKRVEAAAAHLKLARAETEQARRYLEQGYWKKANGLLARAEADAELAMALTQEASIRAEAQEAIRRAREIRSIQ